MSKTVTINMPVSIDEQALKDTFITAIEQGCGYWAERTTAWNESVWDDDKGSFVCTICDVEEGEGTLFTVTLETIRLGLERILTGEVKIGRPEDILNTLFECPGGWDSMESDCILQAGLFGEIIYG